MSRIGIATTAITCWTMLFALAAIASLSASFPSALVGAGTVMSAAHVRRAPRTFRERRSPT